ATYNGKKACSLADIGCTSFFPAKPLGCYGDGGMVFTNDDQKAEVMKSIRTHGSGNVKYDHARIGVNARLDALQAAILSVKLKYYQKEIADRNNVANYYTNNLSSEISTPVILEHNTSVFAQYVIQVSRRDELQAFLKESEIPTAIHYPKSIHMQNAFAFLNYKEGDFPVAEAACKKVLALPMHPFLPKEEQDLIIEKINSFYQS
ncbi:MAG: DegT/DnrJ/EryC1/StrS family aminotransferase, partial [Candidatus Heimdallarchaeota archaeon]|nr:DegT/DnrJ/EryC1/StrS family aminotransferase [Candidatus Heimdallarchaeota archaeon]